MDNWDSPSHFHRDLPLPKEKSYPLPPFPIGEEKFERGTSKMFPYLPIIYKQI